MSVTTASTGASRRRWAIAVVAVAVLAAGVGVVVGRQLKSPADAAADAEPPAPSRITVPVERRTLESRLVANGEVQYSEPIALRLAGAVDSSATPIITRAPERDAVLQEGDVVMEVSGRPVFVFEGALPTFRPLGPGDTGPDVKQLEAALVRLGTFTGQADEVYDDATEAAIDQFYGIKGYRSEGPSDEQRTKLRAADKAVADARRAYADAQAALSRGAEPLTPSQRLRAQQDLQAARDAVPIARAAADKRNADAVAAVSAAQLSLDQAAESLSPAEKLKAEQDLQAARDAVPAMQASADRRNAEAVAAVTTATAVRANAVATRDRARATRIAAGVAGAVNPDTGQPYTAAELAALDEALATREVALLEADASLRTAQNTRDQTAADTARDVKSAKDTLALAELVYAETLKQGEADKKKAEAALNTAIAARDQTAIDAARDVRSAENALAVAELTYNETITPKDTASLQAAVQLAGENLLQVTKDLDEIRAEVGTKMPAGQMIFLPSLPTTITEVSAEAGKAPADPFATVSSTDTLIEARISSADARLVQRGAVVAIELRDANVASEGVLVDVGSDSGGTGDGSGGGSSGTGDDGGRLTITVRPNDPDAIRDFVGFSARLTIAVSSTDGKVLAVPVAALSVGADGETRVEVERSADDGPGAVAIVAVTLGLSADGYAEIRPVEAGALAEGDRVVVGTQRNRSDGTDSTPDGSAESG